MIMAATLVTVASLAAAGATLGMFASAASQGLVDHKNGTVSLPARPPGGEAVARAQDRVQGEAVSAVVPPHVSAKPPSAPVVARAQDRVQREAVSAVALPPMSATPSQPPVVVADQDPITMIVNEAIVKAEAEEAALEATRAKLVASNKKITEKAYGGTRKKGTYRHMRGGDRLLDELKSLGVDSPSPRPAFMKLITVRNGSVAGRLVPVFNTFINWKKGITGIRFTTPDVHQKGFADHLFDDIPKEWRDINPVFKRFPQIAEYERVGTAMAALADERNPRKLTPEESAMVESETQRLRESKLDASLINTFLPPPESFKSTEATEATEAAAATPVLTPEQQAERDAAADAAWGRSETSETSPLVTGPNGFDATPDEIAAEARARAETRAPELTDAEQHALDDAEERKWEPRAVLPRDALFEPQAVPFTPLTPEAKAAAAAVATAAEQEAAAERMAAAAAEGRAAAVAAAQATEGNRGKLGAEAAAILAAQEAEAAAEAAAKAPAPTPTPAPVVAPVVAPAPAPAAQSSLVIAPRIQDRDQLDFDQEIAAMERIDTAVPTEFDDMFKPVQDIANTIVSNPLKRIANRIIDGAKKVLASTPTELKPGVKGTMTKALKDAKAQLDAFKQSAQPLPTRLEMAAALRRSKERPDPLPESEASSPLPGAPEDEDEISRRSSLASLSSVAVDLLRNTDFTLEEQSQLSEVPPANTDIGKLYSIYATFEKLSDTIRAEKAEIVGRVMLGGRRKRRTHRRRRGRKGRRVRNSTFRRHRKH